MRSRSRVQPPSSRDSRQGTHADSRARSARTPSPRVRSPSGMPLRRRRAGAASGDRTEAWRTRVPAVPSWYTPPAWDAGNVAPCGLECAASTSMVMSFTTDRLHLQLARGHPGDRLTDRRRPSPTATPPAHAGIGRLGTTEPGVVVVLGEYDTRAVGVRRAGCVPSRAAAGCHTWWKMSRTRLPRRALLPWLDC